MSVVAATIQEGYKRADGWTVYGVSYEVDSAPICPTCKACTVITHVWTHELKRAAGPKSRKTEYRDIPWHPTDVIE